MDNYAVYLRKSRSDDSSESVGETLRKHREALWELAQKKGIFLAAVFEEVVSGENVASRPQMKKLLKDVRNRCYQGVLCMDIDRLGRGGMQDQGLILDAFRDSGTRIVTPDRTYDLRDETDEELTEFKAFFARREYKMIRKRMRRGTLSAARAGAYLANPPFGYRPCKIEKRPSLEIVPPEAELVRLAYARYLAGVGATAIADELNLLGAKTRRGAKWTRNTVRYLLTNPVYCGKVYYNRRTRRVDGKSTGGYRKDPAEWIIAEGLHKAIISEDDFAAAARRRAGRAQKSSYDGRAHYALTGLITCGNCGKSMQIVGRAEEKRLHCMNPGCIASVKLSYVEKALLRTLRDVLSNLTIDGQWTAQTEAAEAAVRTAETALQKAEAVIARLYRFLEDGIYDADTFRSRKEAADTKIEMWRGRYEDALRTRSEWERRAGEPPENLFDRYRRERPEIQNALLYAVLSCVVYQKEKKSPPREFSLKITLREHPSYLCSPMIKIASKTCGCT